MARHRKRRPVRSRSGRLFISKKIRLLIREGKPPKQAAAIAYSMYRRRRRPKRR